MRSNRHTRTTKNALLLATTLVLAACGTATAEQPHQAPATSRSVESTTSTTTTTTTPPPPPTTPPTTLPATSSTVSPATQPAPSVPSGCPPEIVDAVHRHFDRFGVAVADWMVSIVWRESNCQPNVVSPTWCRGLTQLALPLHADLFAALGLDWQTSWMDPDANLAAAALLYALSGASPWRL